VTPVQAARTIAKRSADLGTSIYRCADAILRDRDEFERRYARAARGVSRESFPALLEAHAVLSAHHEQKRTHPA
jgi:hypothetical protein